MVNVCVRSMINTAHRQLNIRILCECGDAAIRLFLLVYVFRVICDELSFQSDYDWLVFTVKNAKDYYYVVRVEHQIDKDSHTHTHTHTSQSIADKISSSTCIQSHMRKY